MGAVHKYYSKISENVDNIKDSIDIASLLVKPQEVDSKIEVNESNISDNLSLINTNKSNISDNLSLINTNKSNVSDYISLINTNKSNISDNLSLINTNITTLNNINLDLTNLRGRINTHQNDIQKLNEKVYKLSDCINSKILLSYMLKKLI